MSLAFLKMHGLGNDFVVLDARVHPIAMSEEAAQAIGNRRTGIGFDQILMLCPPRAAGDVRMRIWNPDGTEAQSCGNGTRCVAALLMAETGKDSVGIETLGGLLKAANAPGGLVTVDMGAPRLEWEDIPLAERMDTRRVDIHIGPIDDPYLVGPAAVSMGNPHAIFFVDDAKKIQLEKVGPLVENHPLFPERANVSFAQIRDASHVTLRVWERSAGATLACGTAACATLVAGVRLGKLERKAEIMLPGGSLTIEWRESDDHVLMTGPAETAYAGTLGDRLEGLLAKAHAA